LFVLARAGDGNLVSVTIEGKVNESFGESLKDWKANGKGFTANKRTRFESLCQALGLTEIADTIHYQLLHRAASAIFEAKRFNARYAVLIVHSFSPQRAHWEAFTHFVGLYGHVPQPDNLLELVQVDTLRLFAGWATGNLAYLEA